MSLNHGRAHLLRAALEGWSSPCDRPWRLYATVVGVILSVGTAYIVLGFASIMDYVQLLHGLFLAPLFGTFLLGMFWRRTTAWGGFAGSSRGPPRGWCSTGWSYTLWDKVTSIATKIYGASEVIADTKVRAQIKKLQDDGCGEYPVCIAKTQYSFSTDPSLKGAPTGHALPIREVRLAAGAKFVVMVCGDIMTMPGLPKAPASGRIDLNEDEAVIGLF